jgi:hypothetical protein
MFRFWHGEATGIAATATLYYTAHTDDGQDITRNVNIYLSSGCPCRYSPCNWHIEPGDIAITDGPVETGLRLLLGAEALRVSSW